MEGSLSSEFPIISAPIKPGKSGWPSGLRRCVQVAVSSEAWVRTPQAAKRRVIGSVAEYLVANEVARVRFPDDAPSGFWSAWPSG